MVDKKKISKSKKAKINNLNLTKINNLDINKLKNIHTLDNLKKFEGLDKYADSARSVLFGVLIFYVIYILYIGSIIFYLNKLKDCPCFQYKNETNYTNLTYLIIIESILLAFSIIITFVIIGLISATYSLKSGGAKGFINYVFIGLILQILIYGYFIYYVYKLYENVDKDCECTQSWLRYLLYIQTGFMLLAVLGHIVSIFNLMSL
jgi:hypothetical protein